MHKILFVCELNSGRSVMAEAFMNALADGMAFAESAGLEAGTVNPLVVEAMAEVGLDVSGHKSRVAFGIFKEGQLFSHVITVCSAEADAKCPVFPGVAYRTNWPFPDPADATGTKEEQMEQVRAIRDQIKRQVKDFIAGGMK